MARARTGGAGAGYAWALVFLGAGFFISLLLAIVFWAQLGGARQEAQDATDRLRQYVTPNEEAQPAVTGLSRPVVKTLLDQNRELKQRIIGNPEEPMEVIAQQLEEANVQGALVRTVQDLRREVEDKQNQIGELERARDQAVANAQRAVDEQANIQKQYNDSLAAMRSQIEQIEQAFRNHQGSGQELETRLTQQFSEARQALANQNQELETRIQQAENERRQLEATLRERTARDETGASRITQADASVTAVLPDQNLIYLDRGSRDRLSLGMTFEVFERGEIVRLDDEDDVDDLRGIATVEVVELRPNSAAARIVRSDRVATVDQGDQLVNVVYDPNRTLRFHVYGDFDIDNTGDAQLGDRRRVETLIERWGGALADQLSYDVDFLVLGEEPPLPQQPPSNVIDPTAIAAFVESQRNYERYQTLIGQARELSIPILNQNRFLNLVGYYQR